MYVFGTVWIMAKDTVTIDILKRMARRSIGLRVTEEGLVEVRAPRLMPMFLIHRFVISRRDWILRAKKRVRAMSRATKPEYSEGSVLSVAGTRYAFHITDGNAIVFAGKRIFFPKKFVKHPKAHTEAFLRKYAKTYLTARAAYYAGLMSVGYTRISIRDTRSRWGSCSSSGTISFAYRLILADASIIDYVIVHELSHITHRHHRPAFWSRVGEYFPDYKHARLWLRKHGHTLRI